MIVEISEAYDPGTDHRLVTSGINNQRVACTDTVVYVKSAYLQLTDFSWRRLASSLSMPILASSGGRSGLSLAPAVLLRLDLRSFPCRKADAAPDLLRDNIYTYISTGKHIITTRDT